jgi:hypothetical protein
VSIPKKTLCVLAAVAALVVPYELATATASSVWHPTSDASISWSWQLQGTPNLANKVQMYDIDGFDNTAATVSALHANGTIAVCYIDVGTSENFRSDFASFPASVQGNSNGWPGEKWLDIRQISVLAPIMTARMQMCVQKGFDALEPDNIDGYTNNTGFPLTAQDQLAYNEWIANTAHSLGLSVGLKNDVDQTSQLEPYFDWALDEQCNQYSECDSLQVFTDANKAVFNAEYSGGTSFCAADIAAHINGALYDLDLDGKTDTPCGGWGTTTAPAPSASSSTVAPTTTETVDPPAPAPSSSTSTSSTSTTTKATTTTTRTRRSTTTTRPPTTTTTTRRTTTTTSPRRRGRSARNNAQRSFSNNAVRSASSSSSGATPSAWPGFDS